MTKHADQQLMRLRDVRIAAGMSISQLARDSGVSADTVRKAESGTAIMAWAAARIAAALQTSISELEGSDE